MDGNGVSQDLQRLLSIATGVREHPKGSTKYLRCYVLPGGQTLAVERKGKREVTMWLRSEHRPIDVPKGIAMETSKPWPEPGRYGRNSNLKRLADLAEATLCRLKAPTAEAAMQIIDRLV
ncbi:hypothetical protein EV132_10714 [Rhizobium sullae]|uniref:Uncharacterized protein n=2 Tax=Rhizobium sullae TaxID=50338 RepID=A0A4V2V8Z6_RHISU|nr:hypothetical protein EV132_10714 [Rhizobium sullae]